MDNKQGIEWIRLLKANDIHAFNKIYQEYHQALYRNILKITKDIQVSEDLLQEVFIALWKHRSDLDERKSLGGWLFVISFNKSVNYMKKELTRVKNRNEVSLYSFKEPDKELNTDQFEWQYELLQKAIVRLSPQKQKAFVLCKLEGKTYKEAAEELNISKYTVKEYLSLAMASVKDYIKDHSTQLNYI